MKQDCKYMYKTQAGGFDCTCGECVFIDCPYAHFNEFCKHYQPKEKEQSKQETNNNQLSLEL